MNAGISFPMFVLQKDDYSMFVVETPHQLLSCMDPIDVENGRYWCWDANGRAVQVAVVNGRVSEISHCETSIPLAEAFRRYSEVHGLGVDTTGPTDQVWSLLKQCGRPALQARRGGLARFFKWRQGS